MAIEQMDSVSYAVISNPCHLSTDSVVEEHTEEVAIFRKSMYCVTLMQVTPYYSTVLWRIGDGGKL